MASGRFQESGFGWLSGHEFEARAVANRPIPAIQLSPKRWIESRLFGLRYSKPDVGEFTLTAMSCRLVCDMIYDISQARQSLFAI